MWDAASGACYWVIEWGAASLAVAPDGSRFYTSDWDGKVIERDITTGAELRRFRGHTGAVWTTRCSTDGRWLLTASGDGSARVWDIATGTERRRLVSPAGTVWSADLSPDGTRVLSGHADGVARLWHADYRETMRYLEGQLLRDFLPYEREQYGIEET